MARLSTIYDDVNGEKEKVFVLRGDEAYARSTDTLITIGSTFDETNPTYFTADVSVEVLRSLGSSIISLYNNSDDNLLGQFNTTQNIRSHTFEDIQLAYGYDNNIYAKFKGNEQCLKSKSKKQLLHRNIPSQHKTNITITANPQISHGNDLGISVELALGDVTSASALYNRDVLIYVDGIYYSTITTGEDSNIATGSIEDLTDGTHNIRAEVQGTSNINYATESKNVMVGYVLQIETDPVSGKFIYGDSNKVYVTVTQYDGSPVSGVDVDFGDFTETTTVDGLAIFIIEDIETGVYYASYDGCYSSDVSISMVDIDGVTISSPKTYVDELTLNEHLTVRGKPYPLVFTLTGSEIDNIPISIQGLTNVATVRTNSDGTYLGNYDGASSGTVTISANALGHTTTYDIWDCDIVMYRASGRDWYEDRDILVSNGEFKKYNANYIIKRKDSGITTKIKFNMKNTTTQAQDYELEFKVRDVMPSLRVCGISIYGSNMVSLTDKFTKNSIVKFKFENGVMKYYLNGVLKQTTTLQNTDRAKKYVELSMNSSETLGNDMLTFNQLKLRKI